MSKFDFRLAELVLPTALILAGLALGEIPLPSRTIQVRERKA